MYIGRQQDENANILDHEILGFDEELQRINFKMVYMYICIYIYI
jgi:hypothetical protein